MSPRLIIPAGVFLQASVMWMSYVSVACIIIYIIGHAIGPSECDRAGRVVGRGGVMMTHWASISPECCLNSTRHVMMHAGFVWLTLSSSAKHSQTEDDWVSQPVAGSWPHLSDLLQVPSRTWSPPRCSGSRRGLPPSWSPALSTGSPTSLSALSSPSYRSEKYVRRLALCRRRHLIVLVQILIRERLGLTLLDRLPKGSQHFQMHIRTAVTLNMAS